MPKIPREIVDTVRERTDIIEVISRHVSLKRRGNNHVGLCPFHQEKTPSFSVNPQKGIFHCFGCQEGGDVFKFLMHIEGLGFSQAVKELAEHAGVTIEERELTPQELRSMKERASHFDVLQAACTYYESMLWTQPESQHARDYLVERGLTNETCREATLGYAPEGWTNLLDAMHTLGFTASQLEKAGLARKKNNGDRHYDTLRARLIIPIRDHKGRPIAFGARILKGDGPKYINTPESPIYHKSEVLYGLDKARNAIQKMDRVLIVEGYFDVLGVRQAGFSEVVASCGTALTQQHIRKIRRLTQNAILLLDSDSAGIRATARTLPLLLEQQVQAWHLDLPDAKDPDEFVQKHGASAFGEALKHRTPLIEWFVDKKLSDYGQSSTIGLDVDVMTKERVIADLSPLLQHISHTLTSRIAARLGIREESLIAKVKTHRTAPPKKGEEQPSQPHQWKPTKDEVHLLWLIIHQFDPISSLLPDEDWSILSVQLPLKEVISELLSGTEAASIISEDADPMVSRVLASVVAKTELYEPTTAKQAFCQIVDRITRPSRRNRLSILAKQIETSLKENDTDTYRALATKRAELVSSERKLEPLLTGGDESECIQLLSALAQP